MAAAEQKNVEIGDRLVQVGRFSTFKAIHAGELLAEVLNEVPDLSEKLSSYNSEFRSKNTVRISRAAAELRYEPEALAHVTEEAWASSGGYMELPASPGALDVAAFVLPVAFEAARDRVLELLALVMASNSELRDADEANNIDEVLDEKKKILLHSDLGELVDLIVAAGDVLTEQFEGKAGKLRALAAKFGFEIAPKETEPVETTGQEKDPTPETSKPTTSTDSGGPTDGTPETPSTERATASPVGSSTG